MATVFTPEHSSLDRIFAASSTYRIPAYQRPYSWEAIGKSDRDSQVIQMWDDLWNFFQDNRSTNKEYFLGSMVIIEEAERLRTFEVIDGQQRLTTLLLLFAAMRCFLWEWDKAAADPAGAKWIAKAIQTLESFLYNEEGPSLVPTLKLKIERTVGADFNEVLERALECHPNGAVTKLERKHREIARRYFKNRDYFLNRLRECFLPKSEASSWDLQQFDDFFKFLRTRVAIVLIKTTDFTTAYRIFEILNNRGLPLSNLDLLRNFILEQLAEAKITNPDQYWESLEQKYVFTEDFIGRWTESINAAQPQTSAFSDAKRIFDERYRDTPTEKKIARFYGDLEQNLFWYNLIVEQDQRIEDIGIRNAVTFIKLLGNERYSIDLMLALFRARDYQGGGDPDLLRFLQTFRSHALYVCLLGRSSNRRIYDAIRHLNSGKLAEACDLFSLSEREKQLLAEYFDGKIEKNDDAKLLLAAYIWQTEEEPDVVTQHLVYEKSTLEHIIPQNPAPGTNWFTDFDEQFRSDFTYRLGNMTLLTHAKNSANKNFEFSKKKQVYAKTKLGMTLELAGQNRLTEDYLKNRHDKLVGALKALFLT